MSAIPLLDGSLKVEIYYEESDREYEDDICLCFNEDCPDDEKLFKADEVSIYLKPEEVALLILQLNRALEAYRRDNQSGSQTFDSE